MNFKIHRGTQEIGGSCVEILTDTTRIIVDIGMPLVASDGKKFNFRPYEALTTPELIDRGILPNIQGLYGNTKSKVDGMLISHYHQDHHGFLSFADSTVPVYAGEATQSILQFSQEFFDGKQLDSRFINFQPGKLFTIGNITIHPYLMDHSAFDALLRSRYPRALPRSVDISGPRDRQQWQRGRADQEHPKAGEERAASGATGDAPGALLEPIVERTHDPTPPCATGNSTTSPETLASASRCR